MEPSPSKFAPMFSSSAFESWPLVFLGALVFAALFGIAAFMGDALLVESLTRPGQTVFGLGLGAFAGYVGVAVLIRLEEREGWARRRPTRSSRNRSDHL